ncbi:MAG: phosphoethanolamine--lipid A transferase [Burkholderiaceae bacterium]
MTHTVTSPPVAGTTPASGTARARALWPDNLVLALWLTVAGNLPLWQSARAAVGEGSGHWLVIAAMAGIVASANFALLSLISWPRLYRPLASVLVLAAALGSHFMHSYGIVIDSSMLANVAATDVREVRDLLTPALPLTLLLVAGPPLWWIWRRPLPQRSPLRLVLGNVGNVALGLLLAVGFGLADYQGLASLMRNHKTLRYMINPLNSVYASAGLVAERMPRQAMALQPVGQDARTGASYQGQARPPLLVLVIGETVRAENFGLDGYARPTTPTLGKWQRDRGLVNFPQVTSCGTNTEVSVPCIFSPLTRDQGGNRRSAHENLLDVLDHAGLAVLWLDNQSGCKGVCDRVPHVSTRELTDAQWCADGECRDDILLQDLDQRLAALDAQRRARGVVVVLHQMGSHGPAYFKRTPTNAKPFMPECASQNLSDCSVEEVRNAYDNTVAYTDHFLGKALSWVESQSARYDAGLVYLSDHGESLGENGLYLHGLPYAVAPTQQTHVPMVAWLSPSLQQRNRLEQRCLQERAALPVSHDNIFHSVLGLMDVRTSAKDDGLDLFTPCAIRTAGVTSSGS